MTTKRIIIEYDETEEFQPTRSWFEDAIADKANKVFFRGYEILDKAHLQVEQKKVA